MDEARIVELFLARDERAIAETNRLYGALLFSIAFGLLGDRADAEECVSDCCREAWDRIPPERPKNLRAWLCRVVRNTAIDRWRRDHAGKRGAGAVLPLSELAECLPDPADPEAKAESAAIGRAVDAWLRTLGENDRRLFVRRYFLGEPLKKLADETGERGLAARMLRLRRSLRAYLEKEDIYL